MTIKTLVTQSCAIAVGALMLGAATSAQASLIGQTGIGCSTMNLGTAVTCNTLESSVGMGPEFDLNAGFLSPSFLIDIGEDMGGSTTVEFTQVFIDSNQTPIGTSAGYTGFSVTLSDLIWLLPPPGMGNDPDGEIIGFSFAADPGVNGVDAGDVSFTEDSLTVDFSGSDIASGASFLITLDVTHGTPVIVIPPPNPGPSVSEPAALALFGFGLAGLGYARRRRQV